MNWRAGDLLFFYGDCWTSRVIQWATRGPSHVGIVCPYHEHGDLLVESTTLCDLPDVLDGEFRRGVQFQYVKQRIESYKGRVDRLRLVDGWWLDGNEHSLLCKWLLKQRDKGYDFIGAPISGTRVFKWTSFMPYPDLASLFCSELCAAVLMRLGRLPLSNASAFNPASLMRAVRRCGTYGAPETIK